jgi:hypothetical protein
MSKDRDILKKISSQLAEIASLPVQEEKKKLWTANNDLKPIRPMVYMDQLPWHELNTSDEMKLLCEDEFLRSVEYTIRQLLYRWKHFPCDMVVENWIAIPKTVYNLDYGIHIVDEVLKTDEGNDVVSHKYEDQLETIEQLETLKPDVIRVDTELDNKHLAICNEIFDGIIPARLEGAQIHSGVWDRIAQMRSVEKILWDIIDRPEFIEAIVKKFVDLAMSTVDQCEKLGLLDARLQYVHCTGAYTRDLPSKDYDGVKASAKDCWSFGMAQMFTTVSPAMHEEFEIDLVKPLYERFGLLYYGCCEPLEKKIGIIRKLKNVRKISVSPWADVAKCAEHIHGDYVLSLKPNPAFFVAGFAEEKIVTLVRDAIAVAKANNTPIEIIQKDVSTLEYHLDNLDRWEQIVMRIVQDS